MTIAFSDLTGSTDLGERLDPEAMRHVMDRYFDEVRAVIVRHGGYRREAHGRRTDGSLRHPDDPRG